MAFQLRMVLMVTSQPDEPDEDEVDPFEHARMRAAELMREHGGTP
jgi:hypothetical protein